MLSWVINHPDRASCYLFWDNQYVKLLQMQLQQSDGNSYSKQKKDRPFVWVPINRRILHCLDCYTRDVLLNGNGVRNWPVPASMGIKFTRRHQATVCTKYTVIHPPKDSNNVGSANRNPGTDNELIPKY